MIQDALLKLYTRVAEIKMKVLGRVWSDQKGVGPSGFLPGGGNSCDPT